MSYRDKSDDGQGCLAIVALFFFLLVTSIAGQLFNRLDRIDNKLGLKPVPRSTQAR